MPHRFRPIARIALAASLTIAATSFAAEEGQLMKVGDGWAANSVNAVIFRNDPITTVGEKQFIAYYDEQGTVVIGSRTIGKSEWTLTPTALEGNYKDAHNMISLIADGDGYLHISWDHHGHPLRYAVSKTPATPDFGEKIPMTGETETNVTYPQFFKLANGDLLFFYRDGASGRGNLVLNRYDVKAKTWTQVHKNLISGEGARNAYWQCSVGGDGSIHLSWVWRESPGVETNHDLCYAKSTDGGVTWTKTDGTKYDLPIVQATAEIAQLIPQKHELINQTSMCVDGEGNPVIATYWRPEGTQVVQYFIVRHDGKAWSKSQVSDRKVSFSLSGGGSKQIPISRPQVLAKSEGGKTSIYLVYRDVSENEGRAILASCSDISKGDWKRTAITDFSVRYWEPSYDHVRWERDKVLSLYVQTVGQGDGETLEEVDATPVYVFEYKP
jgi:hypothetical protein